MLSALLLLNFVALLPPFDGFVLTSHLPTRGVHLKLEVGEKIPSDDFYEPFHGHDIEHLKTLLPVLRANSERLIWTAGDSSLDNKHWFSDTADTPPGSGYAQVLDPPRMKMDVTYWLNQVAVERLHDVAAKNESYSEARWAAINTAVEATMLKDRKDRLLPQDELIRDNIAPEDILVVSIGANDVVFGRITDLGRDLSTLTAIFGVQTQQYIERLVSKTKPSKVLVCMIYFPDESRTESWVNLASLMYDTDPRQLQNIIRTVYDSCTSRIQIEGVDVVPVPLFRILDGKTSDDYLERVEPSPQGGRKMAELVFTMLDSGCSH